jgi:tryptophanyl-tRNA synthetase
MFTDPNHLRASDPGKIEGNVVFTYLDAFDEDRTGVEALRAHYRGGGLGDMAVKRRLDDILQTLLAPIRDRRAILARNPGHILTVLRRGTLNARRVTQATLDDVRNALGLFQLNADPDAF